MATTESLFQLYPNASAGSPFMSSSGPVIENPQLNAEPYNRWRFAPATDSYLYFTLVFPANYASTTGITIHIHWMSDPILTGNVYWGATAAPLTVNTIDGSAPTYGTEVLTATALPTVARATRVTAIILAKAVYGTTLTNTPFRLRIRRYGSSATDTARTAFAEILCINILET